MHASAIYCRKDGGDTLTGCRTQSPSGHTFGPSLEKSEESTRICCHDSDAGIQFPPSARRKRIIEVNGTEASEWYTPFESVSIRLSQENTLIINAPKVCDKVLYTNDIAELNDQGQFRILGRKDNIINSGGVKIQIEQVEATLKKHFHTPFMITSAPDAKFGEIVVLLIENNPGSRDTYERIQKICEDVLPAYWCPKRVIPVENLPLTETGKPDRATAKLLAQT